MLKDMFSHGAAHIMFLYGIQSGLLMDANQFIKIYYSQPNYTVCLGFAELLEKLVNYQLNKGILYSKIRSTLW